VQVITSISYFESDLKNIELNNLISYWLPNTGHRE